MTGPLLRVRDLRTAFEDPGGLVRAVDGVSLSLDEGETLGLVGESGCGKSVTALSLLRLLPEPPARIRPGSSVRLRGEEVLEASERRLRDLRGGEVGFVFQEPMTSLNPVFPVGEQIAEALRRHRGLSGSALRDEVVRLLDRVGIAEPERRRRAYPHQLSGGMRQRVMIALAISCRPSLLIADEPTTALDVTVQKQVLELLASLQRESGMALLLISHDLGVVARVADRVAVMYAGRIVEEATAAELFARPRHPYTEGLLLAVPRPERRVRRLATIPGAVPEPTAWPAGCRFHPRCPYRWDRCADEEPPLLEETEGAGRRARCWLLEEPGRRRGAGFGARADAGASDAARPPGAEPEVPQGDRSVP